MDHDQAAEIAKIWDHVATRAGATLPWDATVYALSTLPEAGVWTISPDGRAFYTLIDGKIMYAVDIGGDDRVRVTRWPLEGEKIIVSYDRGRSTQTETNAIVWETHWVFRYLDEDEPRAAWQTVVGSITVTGHGEQLDRNEEFARTLVNAAGWTFPAQD